MSVAPTNRCIVPDPSETPVAPPQKKTKRRPAPAPPAPKRQPPYNVILWNDEGHSFEYVVLMLKKLFGHPVERGWQLAEEVHRQGKAIVWTTAREHAELKRDQIHAFGKDALTANCQGSMSATIEPAIG